MISTQSVLCLPMSAYLMSHVPKSCVTWVFVRISDLGDMWVRILDSDVRGVGDDIFGCDVEYFRVGRGRLM